MNEVKQLDANQVTASLDTIIDAMDTLKNVSLEWGDLSEEHGSYSCEVCGAGIIGWDPARAGEVRRYHLFCSGWIGFTNKRKAMEELAKAVGSEVYDGSVCWDERTNSVRLQYDHMHDRTSHQISFQYKGVEFFTLDDLTKEYIAEALRREEEAENEGTGN